MPLNDEDLKTIPRRVLEWYASGTTGLSAETMVCALLGVDTRRRSLPWDCGDFGRCVRALEWMPWLRDELHRLPDLRPEWKPLVDNWDKLEALHEKGKEDPVARRQLYTLVSNFADEGHALWKKAAASTPTIHLKKTP